MLRVRETPVHQETVDTHSEGGHLSMSSRRPLPAIQQGVPLHTHPSLCTSPHTLLFANISLAHTLHLIHSLTPLSLTRLTLPCLCFTSLIYIPLLTLSSHHSYMFLYSPSLDTPDSYTLLYSPSPHTSLIYIPSLTLPASILYKIIPT